MARRIAYLCGMTYLDYDQTKKKTKNKTKKWLSWDRKNYVFAQKWLRWGL